MKIRIEYYPEAYPYNLSCTTIVPKKPDGTEVTERDISDKDLRGICIQWAKKNSATLAKWKIID